MQRYQRLLRIALIVPVDVACSCTFECSLEIMSIVMPRYTCCIDECYLTIWAETEDQLAIYVSALQKLWSGGSVVFDVDGQRYECTADFQLLRLLREIRLRPGLGG